MYQLSIRKAADGKFYWFDDVRNEFIVDDGSFIPGTLCLCAAREASECCCGAWDVEDEDIQK